MQVWSPRPITDEESITLAAAALADFADLQDARGYPDLEAFKSLGRRYNGSSSYGELTFLAYRAVGERGLAGEPGRAGGVGVTAQVDPTPSRDSDDALYLSLGRTVAQLILHDRDAQEAEGEHTAEPSTG